MDGQVKLRSKIQGAMIYPIIMSIVMLLITGMLMVVVVLLVVGSWCNFQ